MPTSRLPCRPPRLHTLITQMSSRKNLSPPQYYGLIPEVKLSIRSTPIQQQDYLGLVCSNWSCTVSNEVMLAQLPYSRYEDAAFNLVHLLSWLTKASLVKHRLSVLSIGSQTNVQPVRCVVVASCIARPSSLPCQPPDCILRYWAESSERLRELRSPHGRFYLVGSATGQRPSIGFSRRNYGFGCYTCSYRGMLVFWTQILIACDRLTSGNIVW